MPQAMILLDGESLTLKELAAIAGEGIAVEIAPAALGRMRRSRAAVDARIHAARRHPGQARSARTMERLPGLTLRFLEPGETAAKAPAWAVHRLVIAWVIPG